MPYATRQVSVGRPASPTELDLQRCLNGDGPLKTIAAILEPPVIEKILTHLGLQARAPARGQALQAA